MFRVQRGPAEPLYTGGLETIAWYSSGYKLGPLDPLRGLNCKYSKNSKNSNIALLDLLLLSFISAGSPLLIDAKSKLSDVIFNFLEFFAVDPLWSHLQPFFLSSSRPSASRRPLP
jgi:hypothetical protein